MKLKNIYNKLIMKYKIFNIVPYIVNRFFHLKLYILALFHKDFIQRDNATLPNRYPQIFKKIGDELSDKEETRILSFWCSTWEEPNALADTCKTSKIIWADINKKKSFNSQKEQKIW